MPARSRKPRSRSPSCPAPLTGAIIRPIEDRHPPQPRRGLVRPPASCHVAAPAVLGRRKGRVHEHFRRFASGKLGRCRPARRHADLDLHRQPVPAQFDRRDRAQSGSRARPVAGRDRASVSAFFLVFAAVQIPLGMALDRFGPRLCLMVGAAITVVGTVVFALGASPGVLTFGRALLGMGTAGSLVASLAVYAQRFRPERFATLTGLQVGIGTLGTLMATAPLALSTAAIGWRA